MAGCGGPRKVVVAAKNFTESNILGEITAQRIEGALHVKVDRKLGLGGTLLAHQAILAGQIDVYPEYTGTAFTTILKHPPLPGAAEELAAVRGEYKPWKIEWLDPLGFDNSFAIVVRGEDARNRRLATVSDAAKDAAGFAMASGYEFLQRPDGYALLHGRYPGIKMLGPVKTMDLGLLYTSLMQRQADLVVASATDGMLSKIDAVVLTDDLHVYPPYEACLLARTEALEGTPGLREALAGLSGKIPTATMRRLNYEVDGKHRAAAEVAKEFLATLK